MLWTLKASYRQTIRKLKAHPPGYSGGQLSALEPVSIGIWAQWRTAGAIGSAGVDSEGPYLNG